MEKKDFTVILVVAITGVTLLGFAAWGVSYFTLYRQIAELRAELSEMKSGMGMVHPGAMQPGVIRTGPMAPVAVSPPAPDSEEGKLVTEGKRWELAPGQVEVGMYVKDILANRMNQQPGRGTIGKVLSISDGVAQVDMGHGIVQGLSLPEICPIRVLP